MIPVDALRKGGMKVESIDVVTQQALSGAGYPGVPSYDIVDNRIPFISGEEEKTEKEPLKIWGYVNTETGKIVPNRDILISAQCNRDGVIDGHTACVKLKFRDTPKLEEVICLWKNYPGFSSLPSAPNPIIIYRSETDRPQPRLDRDSGNGLAVKVGRLRECATGGIQFVGLSHNTVRGAAGGGILNAELLVSKGYIKQ